MSIDFSTLQGLAIPEGVVTQIADASGRVIWSAVEEVTIAISTAQGATPNSEVARITINGVSYDGTETTLTVEKGTAIECYVTIGSINGNISVNGEKVVTGNGTHTYTYTATTNCVIMMGKIPNPFVVDSIIVITET